MNIKSLIFGSLAAAALTGCNGLVYEDQGDCDPRYKVRFTYTRHLKNGDAFASEVKAVNLWLVDDATGKIVWSKSDEGPHVESATYLMDVPADPGRYHLVAWCGKGVGPDFHVPDTDVPQGLDCHLVHNSYVRGDGDSRHLDRPIDDLYHGRTMSQDFTDDEGDHIYNVELTKNTNDINLVLHNLSGRALDKDDFEFYITDSNHSLDWTNSTTAAAGQETITYHAHTVRGISADVELPDDYTINNLNACMAEFTVSRLLESQRRSCYLDVKNKQSGKLVAHLPLIDYAIISKPSRYRDMDDQEYLDRKDSYDLVLVLDEDRDWMGVYLHILSWRFSLQNTEI